MIANRIDFTKIPLDILLVAGQSNAQGAGLGEVPSPFQPQEFLWMFHPDGTITQARERLDGDQVRGRFPLHFGELYLKKGYLAPGRQLLLLQTAQGGTGFADGNWGEGDPLSQGMFQMTNDALALHPQNKLVAFLWHQGELDVNRNTPIASLESPLSALLSRVKGEFGSDFPLIAGGFTPAFLQEKGEQAALIQGCIAETFRAQGGYFAPTGGLTSNREEVPGNRESQHFSRRSLPELAERYFSCFESHKVQKKSTEGAV